MSIRTGLLSRSGPLAALGWLFTPRAMVAAQAVPALPFGVWIRRAAVAAVPPELEAQDRSLDASRRQARRAALAVATALGRSLSEVGAISIEEYRRGLIEAGFAHVEVIDSGSVRNAYAKVETQAACRPVPRHRRPARRSSMRVAARWIWRRWWTRRCTPGRPAAAVRRERLRRQREGLCRQATVIGGV